MRAHPNDQARRHRHRRRVVVHDQKGTVVATGTLGQGTISGYGGCTFPVSVSGAPGGSSFHQVEVTHGKVTSGADAARNGGVALTLGT